MSKEDWSDIASPVTASMDDWSDIASPVGKKKETSSAARRIADVPLGIAKGIADLPGAAVGLLDIPTNGLAGKAVDAVVNPIGEAADAVGVPNWARPTQLSNTLGDLYSPEMKQAKQNVHEAFVRGEQNAADAGGGTLEKFIGGIAEGAPAFIKNPAAAVALATENYGGMKAIAKGTAKMLAPAAAKYGEAVKAGTMTQEAADAALANSAGRYSAVNEGLLTAGQNTQQVEHENPDASFADRAMQGVAGAITGGISRGVSKIPRLGDVEANMALRDVGSTAKTGLSGGRLAAAGKSAFSEGVLEELPQSMQEQVWQNLGTNKPWDSGLAEQAVSGLVAGGAMGGAMGALSAKPGAEKNDSPIVPIPKESINLVTDPDPLQERIDSLLGIGNKPMNDTERTQYAKDLESAFGEVVGHVSGKDGLEIPVTMEDYLRSQLASADITRDRPKAENAVEQSANRLQQLADEESTQQPDIAPPGMGIAAAPIIPVVGALSAAANLAVQTGAHASAVAQQAAAQAAQNTTPEGKAGTPAEAQPNATAPASGTLAGIAAMAPTTGGQTNAASPAQVAKEAPQANAPKAGATAAQATSQGQGIDLSNRTHAQLNYLSKNGKNGHKEAAIAELQRRGKIDAPKASAVSESVPALKAEDSADRPNGDGYEQRNASRVSRINKANTQEEFDAITAEEHSDGERHFEGTERVRSTINDRKFALKIEAAKNVEASRYEAGDWVSVSEHGSRSAAEQEAKDLQRKDPSSEYRLSIGQNDGWSVRKRKKPDATVSKTETVSEQAPIKKDVAVDAGSDPDLNIEKRILFAADSIDKLRKVDVERVLAQGNIDRQKMAEYIKRKRPDLSGEVDDVMAELQPSVSQPPSASPQHVENGKAESATAAVVVESLKKGAANSPLDLRQERDLLLQKVDQAIAAAPTAEEKDAWDSVNQKIDLTNNMHVADTIGYRVFDVPGDGKFKVLNLKEALQRFRERVEASPGFKKPSNSTGLQTVAPWQRTTTGGTEATTKELLDAGEYSAAVEYAKQIGKPLVFGQYQDGSSVTVYTDSKPFEHDGYDDFKMVSARNPGAADKVAWSVIDLNSGLTISNKHPSRMKAIIETNKALDKTTPEQMATAVRSAKANMPGIVGTQEELEQRWLVNVEQREADAQAKADHEHRKGLRSHRGMIADATGKPTEDVGKKPAQAESSKVDYKGFDRVPLGNGAFELRDGNMTVKVTPQAQGKYQATYRSAKSSPHLVGEQGAVDWAASYRDAARQNETDDQRYERIRATPVMQRDDKDVKWANEYKGRQQKSEAEAEAKKAEEQKAAIKADSINGFLDGKAPMQAGAIRNALNKQWRFDGVVMTARDRIESLWRDGKLAVSTYEENKIKPMSRRDFNRASQREQDAHEKKMREAGTKTVYVVSESELGKIAHDYAQHLLAKNAEVKPSEVAIELGGGQIAAKLEKPLIETTKESLIEQIKQQNLQGWKDGNLRLFTEKHGESIKAAMDAGKTVPDDVLADYPGLIRDDLTDDQRDKMADDLAGIDGAERTRAIRAWSPKENREYAKQVDNNSQRNFRNIDALNPLTAPVEDGNWFNIGGKDWQARNGYTGRGWALIDADKKTHPTINNIDANADLIREIVQANESAKSGDSNPTVAAEKPAESKAASATADAGEELTYNKRNRRTGGIQWDDIKDKNTALRVKEVVKAKVYPKPDYQALVDGGMRDVVAHIVKQAYDSIAPSPKLKRGAEPTDEALQSYIAGVNRVMDGVMKWANDSAAVAKWAEKQSRSGSISVSELAAASSLLDTVYPEGWKTHRDELIMLGGNKLLSKLQPGHDEVGRALKDIKLGWPAKSEAWQKQGYKVVNAETVDVELYSSPQRDKREAYVSGTVTAGNQRIDSFIVRGTADKESSEVQDAIAEKRKQLEGNYVLVDKVGRIEGVYADEDAAIEAAREKVKRESGEIKEVGRKVSEVGREGVEHRLPGDDVTTERLKETFGFRGVNFGNWMKGETKAKTAERQLHLNHLFDAFMDLAQLLNVPPKAMSLNGMLGIAVGSQGSGKAWAHFVPGVNEINVTRTNGAGALAHEWGHALDHYFATLGGLDRKPEPYLSAHVGTLDGRVVDGKYVRTPIALADVRPEIAGQFQSIVEAMTKRKETDAEYADRIRRDKDIAGQMVADEIKKITEDIGQAKDGWGTPSFIAEIRGLAERIAALNYGDGRVSIGSSEVPAVVAEIAEAYRAASGAPLKNAETLGYYADHYRVMSAILESEEGRTPREVNTDYKKASDAADSKKKPYWSTKLEMFARAFDAYVVDSLAEKAASNTYLAGIEAVAPQGEERKAIGKAFDFLFAELKTKETERGTALYNISGKDALSPADTAIYGMSAEGKSAGEILKFIASTSRNPFNRQVAKLLLKTGINPKITVGDSNGWKFNAGNDKTYAAAYNPATDTVSLFRPASAERNMVHELVHAATIKALEKNGLSSAQMKALFAHVEKVGAAHGLHWDKATKTGVYGMANIDEFIAEAFSNPKFQAMLKQVSAAPVGGKPSSAWDWFIRVVRGILGLKQGQDNALSQALDIGVGVMRENMRLQSGDGVIRFNHALRSTPEGNRPLNATRLAELRRIAAGLERPKDAVFLRVTEDGKAITTGPKGVRIPETFIRFAESNGLDFEARRNGESRKSDGHTVGDHITSKTEPMPEEYRESGALYFGEGNEFFDRTGKTRYNAAPGKINQTDTAAFKRWFGDSKVVENGLEELLSKPDGVGVLLRDLLAAQNATGSGLNPVQALMLALAKNDKIGRGIVGLVPVDVVNSFSKDGLRPKDGGGNTSMFVNALNAPVSDQVLSTFRGILTSLSTKLANAIATGRDQEIAPALLASDFNLREVGGLLSLQGSTDFWGGNTGVKSVSAGDAAKSTSPGLGSPAKDFKLDATALADLFNKFVSFAPHAKTSASDDLPSAKYIAKQGNPLVVYHGTAADFAEFSNASHRSILNSQYQGDGFHFSADPGVASAYADAARNQFINKDRIFALVDDKMPPLAAKVFKAVVNDGYDAAWDLPDAEVSAILAESRDAGIDLNELLDIAEAVEGTNYHKGRKQSFDAGMIFGSSGPSGVTEWTRTDAVKLGLQDALPNQSVMPVYLSAKNILRTRNPKAAKAAKANGYDGVYYYGEGTVRGVPEYIVFDPTKIKSAIGNSGDFDGSNPDIRYNVADEGWSVSEQAKETVMRLAGRPMLDPSDPFAAENARLREQDQSLWSKAKKQLRRYLAPGGLLPQSVFAEKIKRDSEFQAVEFDVRHLIGGLEQAVKADFGMAFDKLSKEQMRPIAEALAGNVPASLPDATKTAAVAMRQYIDGMSTEYLKIIQEKIDAKMLKAIESGKDSDKAQAINDIELFEKIKGNIGRYVHRSYQAFDDPKWFEKVPAHVLNASRLYLKQGYMEAGETDAKAAQLAEVTLHEILKNGTAYDSMESFIAESKLGAKDLSVLMRRKEVPAQIRALLGEYPDARLNFTKSATKMGRLIWNTRFLDRVRDMGMGSFFFEGKDRPPNATTQIAADGSEVYAPLNGLWTFPEIAQAFKDALGKEQMSDLYRAIVRANGLVKYGKTVLAPTTAMRNWQSAMFFSLANGHFDLTQMKKSISAFREQVSQKATGQDLKYLRHLKQLGVVYDTPYAGEMARLMEDARMDELLSSDKGDAVRWFRKANQLAQGFYTFGDDFWKIIGFENEKAGLMKAGLSLQEAEAEAAKRIRDTYPTYSMVGRGIQWLSRFPLAGTFVSFPAEIIRTSGNMLRTVASDLKSDNPKLRELGMKRAAGMAFVSAAFYGLAALSMAMAGVGDDEDEAIRDLAPEWQKNSTFLYLGRDEKGNLRYFDMSFLDPYGYWKRPITAILRNQPWEDSLASGLRGMLEPFLGSDISAKAIFEAVANQKENGSKVYKEKDGSIDQAIDIADHLRKALQPGVVGNVERLVKAAGDVRKSSGQPYSMEDELVALAGWRATTIDPKTALYYRSFDFTDSISEARKTLTDTLRDANSVSPEDIKDAKARAASKQEQAFKEMSRLIGAAEAAGMSKMQIVQTMRLSNISQANIAALMRGSTPDVSITPQLAARAVRQARQMRGPEYAAEVFDRYRQAMAN